MEKATQLINTD